MKTQGWPKPDAPRTPANWSYPPNLAVQKPRIPGGSVRVNEAEELLASAEAWWDASKYTPGDRWLHNQGVGGPDLDARLGSSTTPNTNDPLYLAPEDRGYCYMPGAINNSMSVPNEAALQITGDIDLRALIAPDSWTPGRETSVLDKALLAAQECYNLSVGSTGTVVLRWTPTGAESGSLTVTSNAVVPFIASPLVTRAWIRATLDVDNGASGRTGRFYYSLDDQATWVEIGTAVTQAGVTSIFAGASTVGFMRGTVWAFDGLGKGYRAQIRDGIDGTLVLDIDADAITSGGQSGFLARTGQVVTINRATSGRKTVAMPNRERKKSDDACVYFPGVIGNYGQQSMGTLPTVTSLEFAVRVAIDTMSATAQRLCGYGSTWATFLINSNNTLNVQALNTPGFLAIGGANSSVTIPATSGQKVWLKGKVTIATAACDYAYSFDDTNDAEAVNWITLGTQQIGTNAGTTVALSGSSSNAIWGANSTGIAGMAGRLYAGAQWMNGSLLTKVSFQDAPRVYPEIASPANGVRWVPAGSVLVAGQGPSLNWTANSGMRVLPERWEAGRPVMLFGTDDYCEVQGAAQQSAFGVGPGQPFTVVTVMRQFPAMENAGEASGLLFRDNLAFTGCSGWALRSASGTGAGSKVLDVWDGVNRSSIGTALAIAGNLSVTVASRAAGKLAACLNVVTTAPVADTTLDLHPMTTASVTTSPPYYPLRIGRFSGAGTVYGAFEFVAAAVFRRVLSQREIDLICRYYGTVWS